MMDDQLVAKGSLACEMEVAVALARALREQQTLLQSTDIGVAFIQKRAIQRCNQQFAEIFGFPDSASLLGQASYLLHPSRDAFRALGRDAFAEMAQGRTFRSVRQMRRKDGSLFWASLTGRFINSEAPSEGAIWTLDDVDAQILMRSKLDAIQLQTQILLDHAMVGVAYVREHKVVQCNRHAEQMLGYAPGQLCGQAARDWFASDSDWAVQLADYAPTLAMGKVFSAELNLRRQDGAELICETRSKALDDGSTVWIFMDITERRQTQEALRQAHAELKRVVSERTHALVNTTKDLDKEIQERKYDREHIYWLAHYDPLTGLPNRSLLAERSQQAIAQAQCSNTPLAVLFLDLDHFKHINDSLGHKVGDSLLTHIAKRLSQTVREYDTVARLGGDEFVLLLPRANAAGAQRVAGKVAQAFNAPFQVGPHELTLGCSVGVALYPQDGRDFDALVQSADMAMYGAKRQGRNTYRFFTSQMQAQSMRALELENALRRALEREQLCLHYQPQVDANTGKILGVEALLRWQNPKLGAVSPAEFIPIAESSGLILPIGQWVMATAAQQLKAWRDKGLLHLTMSVNLSARQFHQPQLPDLVRQVLEQANIPAQVLELELTESAAMSEVMAVEQTVAELQKLGVRLSIDDFGTGYASLTQLKRLPTYKLKIDQSFVRDMDNGDADKAMVNAIVRMAQAMGLRITAEGVETQEQLKFLQALGCDEAQGYYFSRPRLPHELEPFLLQDSWKAC